MKGNRKNAPVGTGGGSYFSHIISGGRMESDCQCGPLCGRLFGFFLLLKTDRKIGGIAVDDLPGGEVTGRTAG